MKPCSKQGAGEVVVVAVVVEVVVVIVVVVVVVVEVVVVVVVVQNNVVVVAVLVVVVEVVGVSRHSLKGHVEWSVVCGCVWLLWWVLLKECWWMQSPQSCNLNTRECKASVE